MKKILALLAMSIGFTSVANAAVPAAVTTALTDAGTDAGVIGGAVLVVLVGVAAYRYMRKVL